MTNLGTRTWEPGSAPGRVVGLVDEVATTLAIPAPVETGAYLVEVDLVREGEHWFGDDGSPTAHVVLRVDA